MFRKRIQKVVLSLFLCELSYSQHVTNIFLLSKAAYLAQKGLSVGLFERRHLLGGAAVTEEIVPGYKFSRASYVLSLLRPTVIKELELVVSIMNMSFDLIFFKVSLVV